MFEITARTNAHYQTLSIDGEEFGGGPYAVCVNRAHMPVSVNKLPVWADGWPRVWSVLRALLSAWEFNADDRQPKTPAESIECARLLWRAAVKIARAGKPVTCWSILAAAYPAPRKPGKPRRLVGRLLSHTPDGRSIMFDAGRFDLCMGRMERGAFIGHRSMGSRKTFAGAEKAARRALVRLDSGDKAQ